MKTEGGRGCHRGGHNWGAEGGIAGASAALNEC